MKKIEGTQRHLPEVTKQIHYTSGKWQCTPSNTSKREDLGFYYQAWYHKTKEIAIMQLSLSLQLNE